MSVYTKEPSQNSGHLTQSEVHLYGSSRLGIFNTNTDMEIAAEEQQMITFTKGNKFFELSNHLGNVLATVSDKKFSVDTNGDEMIDYYTADVVSANDYYPFGMMMPGRKFSSEKYRYGFNGKELDRETAGTTTYDYGFRIYNPGLGRFLSVDPLTKSYPMLTPYQYASNTPIWAIDLDGLEAYVLSQNFDAEGNFQNSSFVWDEKASPVNEGKLHYIKNVGTTSTRSIVSAKSVSYKGGTLNPTPAPSSVLGTENYYKWRENDFNVRQGLMDKWYTIQPSAPDYYLDYGDKYIRRFTRELAPKLSPEGREWLGEARLNLQEAIEVKLQTSPSVELSSRAFRKFAFDSHVRSYEDAGLFNLPISDLIQIGMTPDTRDLISLSGLRQIKQITSDYIRNAGANPLPTAYRILEFGLHIYRALNNKEDANEN